MESSLLDWSQCTPYELVDGVRYQYNPFKSTYANLRFVVTQATPYVIKAGDAGRLPMISYKAYGTTALWRVIAEYNQIQDPIADVYPGREIMIPDKSQVVTLLTNTKATAAKSTETASFFI